MKIPDDQKGLEHADRPGAAAYGASIQFAIAERYESMGDSSLACEYAKRADEIARGLDDLELRKQISEFLLNEAQHEFSGLVRK